MLLFAQCPVPADLAEAVDRVSRLPYAHVGRADAETPAVDCAGAVEALLGLDCRLPTNYTPQWFRLHPDKMLAHADLVLKWPRVVSGLVAPWDVLVFALESVGDHSGVYLGDGRFAHSWGRPMEVAMVDSRIVRVGFNGARWVSRIAAVYRPKGMAS